MYTLLPRWKSTGYNLRKLSPGLTRPRVKSSLLRKIFITRVLCTRVSPSSLLAQNFLSSTLTTPHRPHSLSISLFLDELNSFLSFAATAPEKFLSSHTQQTYAFNCVLGRIN